MRDARGYHQPMHLFALFTLVVCLSPCAPAAERLPQADDPAVVTPADQQAMLVVLRRATASDAALAFAPDTMPAKLLRATGHPLIASAYRVGKPPLTAVAARGTLFEQLNAAARTLRKTAGPDGLAAARLKLDVVQRSTPIGLAATRGLPVSGIHGVRVRAGATVVCVSPSEALRLGLADGEAFIRHALSLLKPPPGSAGDVVAERLDVVSFIEREPGGGGPPVSLYRSMPLVRRVTRRRLTAACMAGGDWLLRFQRPDGSFHYAYDARTDKVLAGANIVRHAGAAWSLVQAFEATRQQRFLDGAGRALQWLLRHGRTRGELMWIEHAGRRPLGAAALAVVGLVAYRSAKGSKEFDPSIHRLGRFLLRMQRPDGYFWTAYDPRAGKGYTPEDRLPLFAPGEAFLALTRLQRAMPDPAWRRAAARAADFTAAKRDAWLVAHGLEAIFPDAWTMMALDELHALGLARRTHADYCLFLAQAILDEQQTERSARWPDHVGAPRTHGEPPEATPTACRCEGLLAAWRLARRMGAATDGYRCAVLRSVRFQLRHQFTAVSGYLLPNPARAVGGFHASHADWTVRIDTVQHNLASLAGAARMLDASGGP